MLAVDSNIFIYGLNEKVLEHEKAAMAVKRAQSEGVLVNTLIQMEVCHHLVKRLGAIDGAARAEWFLAGPFAAVEVFDAELVNESLALLTRFTHLGVGGRDASVLATMSRHGVKRLMTHDDAFKRVPGIDVIDPVAKNAG